MKKIESLTAILLLVAGVGAAQEASWPDLSRPAQAVGGGERDAAVVVGIEDYFAVPGVPGAKSNAKDYRKQSGHQLIVYSYGKDRVKGGQQNNPQNTHF